jgi:class 3 adenylate cyclase
MKTKRRLAAILAADVVGYSRLMGVDEVATLQALGSSEMHTAVVSSAAAAALLVNF